jgi:hypothetical protein
MRYGVIVLSLVLCIGCAGHGDPKAASPTSLPILQPTAELPGYVLHIPGVSGESVVDHNLVEGLRDGFADAGQKVEIQIYDWTEHDPGIPALQAYRRNHDEAKKIADKLTAEVRGHTHGRIYLTCHSGGAGLAVWALEDLPADVQIDSLLILAPALSPDYDLSKALAHVQDRADVFWSDLDTGVLNYGTRTFGTIDGKFTAAAGYVGFSQPPGADAAQYAKLHQYPYESAWSKFGNDGDHIGPTETPFAEHVLAPVLIHDALPVSP